MGRRRRTQKNLQKKLVRYGGSFGLLLVSIVFCLHTLQLPARMAPNKSPLAVLNHVPIPEMPARAVALVQAASGDSKISVITNTLWAVSGLARPGVMPYVISALCRANPSLADVVVATAVEINNTPMVTIICAAKAAAPEMVEKIAIAAFKANPRAFQGTALTLIDQTPLSSTNILHDLGEALPDLQPFVDTARIQADQIIDQSSLITTNEEARELSLILGHTMYAITNSGQTIDEVLTNNDADANAGPPVDMSTNLNTNPAAP